MKLAEFNIHTKMFLIDSKYKIYYKWGIDNFIKYSNNNFIILFIIKIRAKSTIYIKKSLIICRCQIEKFDYSNLNNIDYINEDVVSLW